MGADAQPPSHAGPWTLRFGEARRFLELVWHVSGRIDLPPGQSSEDAFDRLDPLFRQTGTTRERTGDTLTFRKQDPAAQDKMSVFESGILWIENAAAGSVLRYRLASRTLLFCFLAPLLFLAFAQVTITLAKLEKKPSPEAIAEKKKAAEKYAALPMNPIDKALGAPAPAKPKKDKNESGGRKKKPSATPAYVFAAIFALLYAVGRLLEARLVKSLFRKALAGG